MNKSNEGLLTETADYDTPGSWGPASVAWPSIYDPEMKVRMIVIKEEVVPYGAYVTVGDQLRIHPDHIAALRRRMLKKN